MLWKAHLSDLLLSKYCPTLSNILSKISKCQQKCNVNTLYMKILFHIAGKKYYHGAGVLGKQKWKKGPKLLKLPKVWVITH